MAHELLMGQRGGGSPVGKSRIGAPAPLNNQNAMRWGSFYKLQNFPLGIPVMVPNPYDNFQTAVEYYTGDVYNGGLTKRTAANTYPSSTDMTTQSAVVKTITIVEIIQAYAATTSMSPVIGYPTTTKAAITSVSYYRCPADNKIYVLATSCHKFESGNHYFGFGYVIIDFATFNIVKVGLFASGGNRGIVDSDRSGRIRCDYIGANIFNITIFVGRTDATWESFNVNVSTVIPSVSSTTPIAVFHNSGNLNYTYVMARRLSQDIYANVGSALRHNTIHGDNEVNVNVNGTLYRLRTGEFLEELPFSGVSQVYSGMYMPVPHFQGHSLSPDHLMTTSYYPTRLLEASGDTFIATSPSYYIWSKEEVMEWLKEAILYQYGDTFDTTLLDL